MHDKYDANALYTQMFSLVVWILKSTILNLVIVARSVLGVGVFLN